jgi:fucose permease
MFYIRVQGRVHLFVLIWFARYIGWEIRISHFLISATVRSIESESAETSSTSTLFLLHVDLTKSKLAAHPEQVSDVLMLQLREMRLYHELFCWLALRYRLWAYDRRHRHATCF